MTRALTQQRLKSTENQGPGDSIIYTSSSTTRESASDSGFVGHNANSLKRRGSATSSSRQGSLASRRQSMCWPLTCVCSLKTLKLPSLPTRKKTLRRFSDVKSNIHTTSSRNSSEGSNHSRPKANHNYRGATTARYLFQRLSGPVPFSFSTFQNTEKYARNSPGRQRKSRLDRSMPSMPGVLCLLRAQRRDARAIFMTFARLPGTFKNPVSLSRNWITNSISIHGGNIPITNCQTVTHHWLFFPKRMTAISLTWSC